MWISIAALAACVVSALSYAGKLTPSVSRTTMRRRLPPPLAERIVIASRTAAEMFVPPFASRVRSSAALTALTFAWLLSVVSPISRVAKESKPTTDARSPWRICATNSFAPSTRSPEGSFDAIDPEVSTRKEASMPKPPPTPPTQRIGVSPKICRHSAGVRPFRTA